MALVSERIADLISATSTPALVADILALDANIARLQADVSGAGLALRPHVKGHKCVEIARRQVAAGAVGICCATAFEAAAMAAKGLRRILVTSPQTNSRSILALREVAALDPDLTLVVDSPASIQAVQACSRPHSPLDVLIDVDTGQDRTGARSAEQAIVLAEKVRAQPGLRFAGLQAYYGHLQLIAGADERRKAILASSEIIRGTVAGMRGAALDVPVVSGGGTGTYRIDAELGYLTEIQAGSYVFLDDQYRRNSDIAFHQSLFVLATVISAPRPGRLIVDAGWKALGAEAGPATVAWPPLRNAAYRFMGDEHGAVDCDPEVAATVQPGDAIVLSPHHCDTTVNLFGEIIAMHGDGSFERWPVAARR